MQRLVNESQWPWSEQFSWHADHSGKETQDNRGQSQRKARSQCLCRQESTPFGGLGCSVPETGPRSFHSWGALPMTASMVG